jgi:hypothetical protein|tara:strand:+ start:337 stop:585 length:249 start_codon:yes stop_codon:yes gene_type:complete
MIDPGRTTRDWFAGMAIAGLIAEYGANKADMDEIAHDIANAAYDLADAMMEERALTPELSGDAPGPRIGNTEYSARPGRMTL